MLPKKDYLYQKASLAKLNGFDMETNPSKFNLSPNLPIILAPIQEPKDTPHKKAGPVHSFFIY